MRHFTTGGLLIPMILAFLGVSCSGVKTAQAPEKPAAVATTVRYPIVEQVYMWVYPHQVDCAGITSNKCLRVKYGQEFPKGGWENLYYPIEGFVFEEGKTYQLLVERTQNDPNNLGIGRKAYEYRMIQFLGAYPTTSGD